MSSPRTVNSSEFSLVGPLNAQQSNNPSSIKNQYIWDSFFSRKQSLTKLINRELTLLNTTTDTTQKHNHRITLNYLIGLATTYNSTPSNKKKMTPKEMKSREKKIEERKKTIADWKATLALTDPISHKHESSTELVSYHSSQQDSFPLSDIDEKSTELSSIVFESPPIDAKEIPNSPQERQNNSPFLPDTTQKADALLKKLDKRLHELKSTCSFFCKNRKKEKIQFLELIKNKLQTSAMNNSNPLLKLQCATHDAFIDYKGNYSMVVAGYFSHKTRDFIHELCPDLTAHVNAKKR